MNGDAPKAGKAKSGDASLVPVFYSVVVYPGVGQWMQQRRNAGTFYCLVFTVLGLMFCWLMFVYLREVVPIIRDALQGQSIDGREFPPLRVIVQPFAAVLFVYFANVIDVVRGRLQIKKASEPSAP